MTDTAVNRLTFYRGGVVRRGWRWRFQSANGDKMANGGEGYANFSDAAHGAAISLGVSDDAMHRAVTTGADLHRHRDQVQVRTV